MTPGRSSLDGLPAMTASRCRPRASVAVPAAAARCCPWRLLATRKSWTPYAGGRPRPRSSDARRLGPPCSPAEPAAPRFEDGFMILLRRTKHSTRAIRLTGAHAEGSGIAVAVRDSAEVRRLHGR